ncbi:profilin [Naegleria gruberi]|uniref:Profilin n=1 Tax=Naegleria gruberi TaxID=5762 RepID=D2VRA1_NAEGR|nr:profilin [Naegleria gruberi]EFC40637.1 profilin [Naegleria gruberi]|eukprot:XP_002673381.1 profilin [Naegleria gruberi]
MSWTPFVDSQFVAPSNGLIQKGFIMGRDGTIWGVTDGWAVTAQEAKNLAGQVANPSSVPATGITLGGVKYMGLVADEENFQGFSSTKKQGVSGVVLKSAVIVGLFGEPHKNPNAYSFLKGVADSLVNAGTLQ